jgi:hypothetical protein
MRLIDGINAVIKFVAVIGALVAFVAAVVLFTHGQKIDAIFYMALSISLDLTASTREQ